jgi:DNA primase
VSSVTDEIKARVDLVELIGRSVALRRSGSSYKGLCPFHQEKTPSFYVFPQSHTWVCFGCGKKGTAFDWLMEREHLEFGEALRSLAQVAGVELPERRDAGQDEATARLYEALARAQAYYQGMLEGAAGAGARRYLAERGVSTETMATFGLGFAPAGGGLVRYLGQAGFGAAELEAAGLVGTTDDGRQYDFFRERVLFPIRDARGRTVAFGGRVLGTDQQPKYLNSRDTLLFHKQETLFAFDLARRAMQQERRCVIVEGYMDAVIAHQHGYRNVVATLGTAVTDRHLRQLRRLVDEVVLALDSDAAGQAATWRALEVAEESLRVGLTPVVGPNRRQRRYVADTAARLRVLELPGAKDPDELIRSAPAEWPRLVQTATPVIDFVLSRLEQRHDLSTADGKAAAADEMSEVLVRIANPIEQTHYVQQAAQLLKVGEAAIWQALRRRQRGSGSRRAEPPTADVVEGAAAVGQEGIERDSLDEYALALALHTARRGAAPTTTEEDGGPPRWAPAEEDLALPQSRALLRALVATEPGAGAPGERVPAELAPWLRSLEPRLLALEHASARELEQAIDEVSLQLEHRSLLARRRQAQALLREASTDQERAALLEELGVMGLPQALNEIEERFERAGRRSERAEVR